jgi:hypothetical protein
VIKSWGLADAFGIEISASDNFATQSTFKNVPPSSKWIKTLPGQRKISAVGDNSNNQKSSQSQHITLPQSGNDTMNLNSLTQTTPFQKPQKLEQTNPSSSPLETTKQVNSSFVLTKDPITGRIVINDLPSHQQQRPADSNDPRSTSPSHPSSLPTIPTFSTLPRLSTLPSLTSMGIDSQTSSPSSTQSSTNTSHLLSNKTSSQSLLLQDKQLSSGQSDTIPNRLLIDIQTGRRYEISEAIWRKYKQQPDPKQLINDLKKNETYTTPDNQKSSSLITNLSEPLRNTENVTTTTTGKAKINSFATTPTGMSLNNSSNEYIPSYPQSAINTSPIQSADTFKEKMTSSNSSPSKACPTTGIRSTPKIVMLYPKQKLSSPPSFQQQKPLPQEPPTTTSDTTIKVDFKANQPTSSSGTLTNNFTNEMKVNISDTKTSNPMSSSLLPQSTPITSSSSSSSTPTSAKLPSLTPGRIKTHVLKNSNERIFLPAPLTLKPTMKEESTTEKNLLRRSQSLDTMSYITPKTTPLNERRYSPSPKPQPSSEDKQILEQKSFDNYLEDDISKSELEEIEERCISINDIDKLFEFKIYGIESFNRAILKEIFNTSNIGEKSTAFYVEAEL